MMTQVWAIDSIIQLSHLAKEKHIYTFRIVMLGPSTAIKVNICHLASYDFNLCCAMDLLQHCRHYEVYLKKTN